MAGPTPGHLLLGTRRTLRRAPPISPPPRGEGQGWGAAPQAPPHLHKQNKRRPSRRHDPHPSPSPQGGGKPHPAITPLKVPDRADEGHHAQAGRHTHRAGPSQDQHRPPPSPCPGSTGASFSVATKKDARIKSERSELHECAGTPPHSRHSGEGRNPALPPHACCERMNARLNSDTGTAQSAARHRQRDRPADVPA